MSYRAFKRLLGETSLERKCRFLLGGFILLLITGSFWLYARQTEHLAYDQIVTTCRLLMLQIVDRKLAINCQHEPLPGADRERTSRDEQTTTAALNDFREKWEKHWPDSLRKLYSFHVFRPKPVNPVQRADDGISMERLKEFQNNKDLQEDNQLLLDRRLNVYYGAVRATRTCLVCHRRLDPDLAENDLIAMVKI